MAKMSEIEIVIEEEAKTTLLNFVNTLEATISEIQKFTIALEELKAAQQRVHWTLRLWAWLKNNLGLGARK